MTKTLEEIRKTAASDNAEAAVKELDAYLAENPDSEEALVLRGKLCWSLNRRGQAMTDWLAAVKLNPNSKAAMMIKTGNEILNFYNKDLYNP